MTGVQDILDRYDGERRYLIPMLQDIQDDEGYLSEEAVQAVAAHVGASEHEVYGVATFYAQFRFHKPGKHRLKICQGTACHVKGGHDILDVVKDNLGVSHGETTEDGLFTLDEVACVGCCALAPVTLVDDKVYASQTPSKTLKVLAQVRKGGGEDE